MYRQAKRRSEKGEVTLSVDEMSGIQALERSAPSRPMRPGEPEKREYEYHRHGTQVVIAGFDVVSGQVYAHVKDTRTEADFGHFIEKLIARHHDKRKIHLVMDNLNTHVSETLIRLVAEDGDIAEHTLGEKGRSGVLKSMATREAFLRNRGHRIVCHFTPKHASWLNQIEMWFSILARKVIRRGDFCSTGDLRNKIKAFIRFFNKTLAKPFKWTYQGKPLAA